MTVAVHPGPSSTGTLVNPGPFINQAPYSQTQQGMVSQQSGEANYNYMGPTHPINRSVKDEIFWLEYISAKGFRG